jgi:hypothetical protein
MQCCLQDGFKALLGLMMRQLHNSTLARQQQQRRQQQPAQLKE